VNSNLNYYHAFEALLGVAGIWPVLLRLCRLENPNPIETRFKWILVSLYALFIVRFFYEAFQFELGLRITYAIASIILFTIFLYFEVLYRRHMPVALKIFSVLGCGYFILEALFSSLVVKDSELIGFGAFGLIMNLSIVFMGIIRRRNDYTKNENQLIKLSLWALPIVYLLFITDMKVFRDFIHIPRLGVSGALLFTYAAFFDQSVNSEQSSFSWRICKSSFFSIFLTGMLCTLLRIYDWFMISYFFVFLLNANLVIRIHFFAKTLDANDNFFTFVKSIVEADKRRLVPFLRETRNFFQGLDIKMLSAEDLNLYDLINIHSFFKQNQTHLFNIFDLRNLLSQKKESSNEPEASLEVIEQLIDILDKNDMSHICRVSIKHSVFVVFNYHQAGQSKVVYTQTALISEISELIPD